MTTPEKYTTALTALADAVIHADNGAKFTQDGVIITRSAHMNLKEKLAHAVRMGAEMEVGK